MSKKVLIIRPKVMVDSKTWSRYSKDLAETLERFGVILLDQCMDYEFGEIDGVVWESGKKEEKKSEEVTADAVLNDIIRRHHQLHE